MIEMDRNLISSWSIIDLIRVYTKRRGEVPDFSDGLILKRNVTVEEVCRGIHRSLVDEFKFALGMYLV